MPSPLDYLRQAQTKLAGGFKDPTLNAAIHNPEGHLLGALPDPFAGIEGLGSGFASKAASRAIPAALEALRSSASSRLVPIMETAGEVLPEFTPVGGEGLFNVGRGAVTHPPVSPAEAQRGLSLMKALR